MLELCIPRLCPILTGPVPQIPGPFLGELMATQGERLTYRWKQVTPGHSHTPCFLLLPIPKALYFKVTWQFLSQVCDAQGRRLGRGRLHHRAALHFFPSPQFMMDASNPTQLSASCMQLLGLLSAEPLAEASVLILFNKTYGSVSREGGQDALGGAPWGWSQGGGSLGRACIGAAGGLCSPL